ncbi:MAG: hypothetical protein ABFR36_07770 [Acidobacteriota bacterium]
MKTIKIIILILLLTPLSILSSGFILNEVNEPKTLNIAGDRLIISESESILIYSLSEKKLIRKFGKNGEGPGEFKLGHGAGSLKIDIIGNKLAINSGGKFSWFTMDGEFIKEKKAPVMAYLIPIKTNFISNCVSPAANGFPSLSICLFDAKLNKTSTIFNSKVPVGMGAKIMVPPYNFIYRVFNEKIYLSSGKKNIEISVFNSSGKKEGNIHLTKSMIRIDDGFKKRVYDFYKNDPLYKRFWEYRKKHMYFPEYFPGLKDMIINKEKIYIQTWEIKEKKFQWIIMDMEGKALKKIFLPQNIESAVAYSPVTIHNGKYYYLTEDIDEETWELNSLDLN